MSYDQDGGPGRKRLFVYEGQQYVSLGRRAYERRDGGRSELMIYGSWCAHCGEPFTFTQPRGSFYPARRCPTHRAKGRPVKRRHFMAQPA